MSDPSYQLGVYLHLAKAAERRRRPLVRDRMLLLAGVTAANMQVATLAKHCRREILQHNPQHIIGHWATFPEALVDDEFLALLRQLRRRYPLEKAERLLDSLGVEMANERDAYYSDLEYAAAILGLCPADFESSD
jgi:hypothetical protein